MQIKLKLNSARNESLSRASTKQLIAQGKVVRIELLASTGDGFAERLVKFLKDAGAYTAQGASRTLGFVDASSDEERAIKLHIDGDGADFLREVRLSR